MTTQTETIPVANGSYTFLTDEAKFTHHIGVKTNGTALTGTLAIRARAPGNAEFESIPDATAIDLTAPASTQVTGAIAEIELTPSGVTGANQIHVTVTSEG